MIDSHNKDLKRNNILLRLSGGVVTLTVTRVSRGRGVTPLSPSLSLSAASGAGMWLLLGPCVCGFVRIFD